MFNSGRPDPPEDDADARGGGGNGRAPSSRPPPDAPHYRSAVRISLPPAPAGVTGGRLRSTESAKSGVSAASAASSGAGSFWGLSPAVSENAEPKLKKAPSSSTATSTPVIRQHSSMSTIPTAGTGPTSDTMGAADASRRSASWNVTSAGLRPVPPFFPVERTHAFLNPQDVERDGGDAELESRDGASAAADRIVRCLDELSISAVYDDERAVCLATTGDRCRFYIRFFRIEGDADLAEPTEEASCGGDGSILLELQRRHGSCLSFRSAAREIFRAARGFDEPRREDQGRASAASSVEVRPPCCPPSFAAASASKREAEEEECPVAACLSNVVRLLTDEDGRIDAKLLALESLRCVSDSGNGNESYALKTARALTCCSKAGSVKCREAIMKLLAAGREHREALLDDAANSSDEEDEIPDDLETRYVDEMRGLALSALANSLEAMTDSAASKSDAEEDSKIPLGELLPALLEDVLRLSPAGRRPHDAAEAARCLNALLRAPSVSSEVAEQLGEMGARMRIQGIAGEEEKEDAGGSRRHSRLARELDSILRALSE